MKLTQLKYFVSVCDNGSFASVAKLMYVSQPAIAQAIRDLEEEFNLLLFERNNNRLTVTVDGKWLYEKAVELLELADQLEKELHVRANDNKYVRLGIVPMFGNVYFYPMLNTFRETYPDFHIDMEEAGSFEIRNLVEDNLIDFGVCVPSMVDTDKIESVKLLDVELKFCVHKTHPLATKTSIEIGELKGQRLCSLKRDSYQNAFLKEIFAKSGVPFDVMLYSSQLQSLISMLSYGNCGAFLFGDVKDFSDEIVAIPVKEKLTFPVSLIWNKKHTESQQIKMVKDYIVEYFKTIK